MKYKKVRGGQRRLRAIKYWVENNTELNINALQEYQREYVKFWLNPWSNLVLNNGYKPLNGKLKQAFFDGLYTIFNQWYTQLKALEEPYYLCIWLFEDRVERSQVVCAIGDKIEFYNNTFFKLEENRLFKTVSKNANFIQYEGLIWELYAEIDVLPINFREIDVYESVPDHKILGVQKIKNEDYYIIENEKVWLGRSLVNSAKL